MTINQLRVSRAKRHAKINAEFKRECDAEPVQQITCGGCKKLFETRYKYSTHRVERPGYYTNAGHFIDGDLVCPDDIGQGA